jgi:hypothetical protein
MHSFLEPPRPKFAPAARLLVDGDGEVVTPGGQRIDLRRRLLLRRIVLALVEHHLSVPGEALSPAALIEAGWPGERMTAASGRNRLHVALATLRALGLRPWLHRCARGYSFVTELCIARDASVALRVA